MKQELLQLQQELSTRKGGANSSKSHLNMALMEWNKEQNWDRDNAFIIALDGRGYAFCTITKTEPRHCTLRHIFVLEEYRGMSVGYGLLVSIYDMMEHHKVNIIRFYANKPAVKFYEKHGYKWLGESKQGLPFTYTDITTMELIHNPKQIKRLHKVYEN